MAISRYFGLPGCGKTTLLTKLAKDAVRSGRYKYVFTNVHIDVPGVSYIEFDWLGKYDIRDACVLIDEAMVHCGDRDYANFGKEKIWYLVEHRHMYCDVHLFSQEPDGIDKKIRSLTDRMYYIRKGWLLGHWFSSVIQIPYSIVWPDENDNGENLGRIVMGYKKPPLLLRIFCMRLYRPAYYKYFDSWEIDRVLPPLPSSVKPYYTDPMVKPVLMRRILCVRWLFKSVKKYRKIRKKNKIIDAPVVAPVLPEVSYAG